MIQRNSTSVDGYIYICVCVLYLGSKSLSKQVWLNTVDFSLNLQVETFKSCHKSSYVWV